MFSKQLFLHKECIGGLKTNLRSHAKTCLLITCSCKNHEKINKHAHLDDIQRYGWGTLAHLSWTSIGLMCFPSGFWGYLAEILNTLRKYNQFFNRIYTLLICFDIQTTKKKKRKTSRKPKKHTNLEKTKKRKNKKQKQKNNALTETQTSPRIFCFSSGFFGFVGVLKLRRYQRMQPKHLARIDGRHVHKWKECGRNTVSLCLTIPIGKKIYMCIYIYIDHKPPKTHALTARLSDI